MKKAFLFLSVCIFAAPAAAQTRSKVFDNFDTARGVQVIAPEAAPAPVAETPKTRKTGKKSTRITMRADEGLSSAGGVQSTGYAKLVMGEGSGLGGFTTGDPDVDSFIVESSKRYRIDPLLIYAQMHQESSFKRRALSHKGASGLMQLMPATARRFGVTQIYDPKQNVEGGVKYMRWLLDTFKGDLVLALAGYNAGEGAVWKYGNRVPPYRETQEYVRRITARYASIASPGFAKTVRKVSAEEAAEIDKKEVAPLTVYEPTAIAVRLPDGKMRLVN